MWPGQDRTRDLGSAVGLATDCTTGLGVYLTRRKVNSEGILILLGLTCLKDLIVCAFSAVEHFLNDMLWYTLSSPC